MKKIYLLLLLSFSVLQAQTTLDNINICSNNSPVSVNLTTKNAEILGANSPNDYTISFHLSNVDALANLSPINNPTSFIVSFGSTTIFARSSNNTNSTFYIESFTVFAGANPIINNATLIWCDPTALPIFNLEDASQQITNGISNLIVTFHETESDAIMGVNQITSSFYSPVVPLTQILSVRVTDPNTDCFSITTLTLTTNNCDTSCTAPDQLTAANISDTSVQLNWSLTTNSSFIYHEILIQSLENNMTSTFVVQGNTSFILTGLIPNSCYTTSVKTVCDVGFSSTWSEPFSFCLMDCTNNAQCAEQIILNAFLDTNANGVKDSGEPNFIHGSFTYQVNSGDVISANGSSGTHSILVPDVTNSYTLNFQINPEYSSYFSTSTSYTNISVAAGSGSTTYYFPVTSQQNFSDVQVNVIGNNQPRPGFTYSNTIIYKNNSYQSVPSGTITFTKDPAVTITNISQSGATPTASGFTFDYTNLAPFETRQILVTMQVPVIPTVNLGDILTNSVTITPSPDTIPSNNESSVSQVVVGSYDPNDKMESRGPEIDIDTFTTNDYLYYTIRFENTGTASAEFIRIEDTLHADLNPATFEMIHASHTYNVTRNGNELVWHFFDIDLPPTIEDPILSQGYVHFRIKPNSGFAVGDIIPNTAEIYFDYNPAIITNTFETEFVETLSISDYVVSDLLIYPNPASDILYFNSNNTIKDITVYDLLGNEILLKKVNKNQMDLDVANLSKGIYIIKIINPDNTEHIRKFIKK
ncbi:DUF7619 domain-containing protein [Flavobacterium sp. UBA6135]|uniref:T9SS type A sorting domain-containing protein n=1 Tax=Flavobacterium sp. UBA6135 TaxID=1946553 RepID=UPI0025B9A726|nr:T9SS type A sorting domain-containing protein [Flavobacterium sp. UBA6135]